MKEYIKEGKMSRLSGIIIIHRKMAVDAIDPDIPDEKTAKAFLKKFDTDWVRYNRDIIRKVEDYEKSHND